MSLPALSHLQCLIVYLVASGEHSGAQVREALVEHGVKKSGPAFYQIMARLEGGGYVRGRYQQLVIDGQPIKRRLYRTTAKGRDAMAEAFDFWKRLV